MGNITVGLPRGMAYHRYEALWKAFFDELGVDVVVSAPTTRETLVRGEALAADEMCLAFKIYMGHAAELIGKCGYVFLPRIAGFGPCREMCPRFEALSGVVQNVFRRSGQRFLCCNIDHTTRDDERKAYTALGRSLGFSEKQSRAAYTAAKKEAQRRWNERVKQEEKAFGADGLKILIVAHSYIAEDEYIGKPVLEYLRKNGAVPVRAYVTDRPTALKQSAEISPTCKWELSRELIGGVAANARRADGIIYMSAFPCGPDSMVNDMLMRRVTGIPVLNMVLDGQSGTAGVETRLESFIDIIRFKRDAA